MSQHRPDLKAFRGFVAPVIVASLGGCGGAPYSQIGAAIVTSQIDTAPSARPAPHIAACNVGEPGVFQEITPPVVKAGIGQATVKDSGGTFAMAVHPVNHGTLYVGTL